MKKLFILVFSLAAMTLQAQWVNDPASNTLIANASSYGGEVYLSTNEVTGDTYVQWCSGGSNGWGPTLQRLSFDGTPQWGADGIRITSHEFGSSSEGLSICATADDAVVSCFANYDGQTIAVKINADGSYAWGEQGVELFDGQAFSRTELIAGDDGGVWALGFDYQRLFLQYIKASGSLYPCITVEDSGTVVRYGQMTLGIDNIVFLTYEKTGSGFYTDKEMYVVGYTRDGVQVGPEAQLMASQSFQVTYLHHVVPDGMGGGYAYIWHPGIGSAFNTYVFHYNGNGVNTIHNPDGIAVHSSDPANYYLDAYATVDPVSHDLIIAYIQVDANVQSNDRIFINRITADGEKVWDDGIMVVDYQGVPYGNLRVDAFEDGSGFSLAYEKASASNNYHSTVEAIGFDMECNQIWSKTISSNVYNKSMCENSTGYHLGQNILAWVNSVDGGLYGQNIAPDGTMGEVTPVLPCPGLDNFEGQYVYDAETQTYGALLTWNIPEEPVYFYRLYRTDVFTEEVTTIDFGGDAVSYFDAVEIGLYMYQLRAQFADVDCGLSDPATTYNGQDYLYIDITGIDENESDEIVTLVRVINAKGQTLPCKDLNELNSGLYILQGTTKDGKMVSKKIVVKK